MLACSLVHLIYALNVGQRYYKLHGTSVPLLLPKLLKFSMNGTFHFNALLFTFCKKKKKKALVRVSVELVI